MWLWKLSHLSLWLVSGRSTIQIHFHVIPQPFSPRHTAPLGLRERRPLRLSNQDLLPSAAGVRHQAESEMSTRVPLRYELLTGELSQQQKQLSVTAPLLLLGSLRGAEGGGDPMGWHTEQGGRGSCLARPRGLSHVAQRSLQGTVPMPLCLQNICPHGIRKLQ